MRLEVEISFNLNSNSSIIKRAEIPLDYFEGNNVSNLSKVFDETNYRYKGKRGFQFAQREGEYPAVADGSYQYFDDEGYKGFMSKQLCNGEGNFNINYVPNITVDIQGEVPEYLFIHFDEVSNIYATKIQIYCSGVSLVVNNTRAKVRIDLKNFKEVLPGKFYIYFMSMNKPFQSLRITQMSLKYLTVFTEHEIVSCENSEQLFDSSMKIQPGLVTQYADISIYDRDGALHDFAKKELLTNRQHVIIRTIDVMQHEEVLGTYETDEWDVKEADSIVNVSCADGSDQLDNVLTDAAEVANRSVRDLLELAFSYLPNVAWNFIDLETSMYCAAIINSESWHFKGTVRELLDKICQLGQLRIYKYLNVFIVARCY